MRGIAAVLLLAAAPAAAAPHLDSAPLLPVTRLTAGPVTTGDFNGDGHRDVAYGLDNPTGVAVVLGDGQGGYGPPLVSRIATLTFSSCEAIATADFNADGRLDVALSDFASGPAVYLGLGDGRFAGQSLGGETLNLGLGTGDFDGDGRSDVALAHRGFTSVAQVLFYRGDGAGGFSPAVTWNLPMVLFPSGVVARDFNGDGRHDLAVADSFGNAVVVLLGSATLTPNVRGPFAAGDGATAIDAGDLDLDGRLDVVTADQRGRTVSILRGDGTGSLGPRTTLPGPADARRVLVGSFDGDGRPDVAVSGLGVWTYAGDGAGGLLPPRRYGVSGALALAELTGDAFLDLVAGPSLLAGDGAGAFAGQRTYPVPAGALLGLAADFNRDGRMDVAAAHAAGTVSILHGDGQGGLGPPVSILTGTDPADMATADFNRDGWPDLAIAHAGTQDVVVLRSNGAGGFTRQSYVAAGVPHSLAIADFGGDGIADIAVASDTAGAILVLHGLPDGTFAIGPATLVGDGSVALAAGRFNADVRADLAWCRAPATGAMRTQLLAGTGIESFVAGPPVDIYAAEHALAAADVNADGKLDLVGGGGNQPFPAVSGLGVRLGDGLGGFGPLIAQPPLQVQSLALGDFTGDGRPDVAAFEFSSVAIGLHLLEGHGDGSFGLFQGTPIPVGGNARVIFASDFDGDGRLDVAALVTQGDTLTILRGRAATTGTDLTVGVDDSPDPAAGGQVVRYVATVANQGSVPATGVRLRFRVPIGMSHVAHTPTLPLCAEGSGLVTCDIASLPAGGSFVLTVDATTSPEVGGEPQGWADVYALAPEETSPADNFTTFRTRISPVDVAIDVVDTADPVQPAQPFRYTLTVANEGAYPATRVFARTQIPAGVSLLSFPEPQCASPDEVTIVCGVSTLFAGQSVSFDLDVQAGAFTSVSLVAEVDADQLDVDLSDNTDVEETRMRLPVRGELDHGTTFRLGVTAGTPASESFLVRVPPRAAFEVVLDEASGDLSGAAPVALERLASDASTVLQVGVAVGTGSARALRWQNTTDVALTQLVRVRSQGCSTGCGPDDTLRLRAWNAAGSFARYNTTGDQETVVVLQNPLAATVSGTLWLWSTGGTLLGSHTFVLGPKRTLVLNLAMLVPGTSGSITLTHDGGFGALAGKAIALEPATGFSYDTPLFYRPR